MIRPRHITDWLIQRLAKRRPEDLLDAVEEQSDEEFWRDRDEAVADAMSEEPFRVLEDATEWLVHDEPIRDLRDGTFLLVHPSSIQTADREEQIEHLADLANRLDLPETAWCVDPLKKIERVEDDAKYAYLWLLSDRATGDDVESLQRALESRYREKFGRDPDALHLIMRDVEDVREIPKQVIETTIKPWLKEREKRLAEEDAVGGKEVTR